MKNLYLVLGLFFLNYTIQATEVRVKDATRVHGMEEYFVVGFGIVVGLTGSGDSDKELTQQALANMLKQFQLDIDETQLKVNNCAAVKITARVRGGSKSGDMLNATVSTVGDASSLLGGTLIMSPVLGADGTLWGIAQGSLIVGGSSFGEAGAGGDSIIKNVPTNGMLIGGLKLQVDVGNQDYLKSDEVNFVLREPDFSSAKAMTEAINKTFTGAAIADGSNHVRVKVPQSFYQTNKMVDFIAEVQQIRFKIDKVARVMINERTGSIVADGFVKISEVAISHGNIVVNIKNTLNVSQAQPDSFQGETVVVPDTETSVNEENAKLIHLPEINNVTELVESLNKLGVSPRDMMSIFHILKDSGALHAELVTQ
jgi:flagellar P-ring protein FlgI